MKILSLNTWEGGYLKEEITEFIIRMSPLVDVFCFQEMGDTVREIVDSLEGDFSEVQSDKDAGDCLFNQLTLIRKSTELHEWGTVLETTPNTGLGLWVSVTHNHKKYAICNYHGEPYPGVKTDNSDRLKASEALINFGKTRTEQCIIIGDFNLLETTHSINMFEGVGYVNLIKKYDIKTTRNQYAWNNHPDNVQLQSDYAFVSSNVAVINFSVLPDLVSDHQPLLLEIE